jgi:hypothetical protein
MATPSSDVTIAAACRVRDLQQLLLLRGFFTIFCLLQMEIRFVKMKFHTLYTSTNNNT